MKLFHAFGYAVRGIEIGLKQRNMKIHLLIIVGVVMIGLSFPISLSEWIPILLCIGLVLSTELLNTAIEEIATVVANLSPSAYQKMGPAKDLGAGAVLIASIISATVGIIIFMPHFITLFVR